MDESCLRKGFFLALFFNIIFDKGICGNRSFEIDYNGNQFLKDGKPFRYISGSMHYFRVPKVHWQDRFQKFRAAGLNTVQTYIDWSQHEPEPGVYNFEDILDLVSFIKLAEQNGLNVIIRAGPYICAERDMGGLPYWLLREDQNIILRTNDQTFMKYVSNWMSILLPMLKPLLYANGGPVIAVQVENEYGSYYACDRDYMQHLTKIFRYHLGDSVVLFTTDGNNGYFLKCGKTEGLYATVDFGPADSVVASFQTQREYEPKGPLVNSEFYTEGNIHWGYPNFSLNLTAIVGSLEEMLNMNASVNMYMFHGGTSFGFTNGANLVYASGTYQPDTTSYDFRAPLSESGRINELYLQIRTTLQKYADEPLPPIPNPTPIYAYGHVHMELVGTLFELLTFLSPSPPVFDKYPLTFESMNQSYGFMMYETVLPKTFVDPSPLLVSGIRDRGYVFINYIFVGILSRINNSTSVSISAVQNDVISILVENQGRVTYGRHLNDFQGIISVPEMAGEQLKNWKMTSLPFSNTKKLNKLTHSLRGGGRKLFWDAPSIQYKISDSRVPAVYAGYFVLPENQSEPEDTFLYAPGWQKGVAFINGFNLGRYWPVMGPQITLYVPKSVLLAYPSENQILMFELQKTPCVSEVELRKAKRKFTSAMPECSVQFIDHEILNGSTPLT